MSAGTWVPALEGAGVQNIGFLRQVPAPATGTQKLLGQAGATRAGTRGFGRVVKPIPRPVSEITRVITRNPVYNSTSNSESHQNETCKKLLPEKTASATGNRL
ncbi:uncharacterized protein PGTG_04120 [Puccinia graminis f. sp. tritici CRL 75-36-700-3]|uniref:Uncharacterized protein n=1 Tax=Puccinia graminis f. sp. tritici (strain CRL 75-36-700-3 / race SCCL) TaxID=418459 RepID=E3K1I9_PUCGT|nr:uncharacterized protein PGTG_04120 [Puccinia graminis f. sp. tritici CRL 75-36-700-3]EFP78164.1 hypothetical protein PGTG_04120 [Puccinia graminis f. sp. tritici CRL 75-36-700-3]